MTNRTVLLTGGTGIMGSWVLGEALARGCEVFVLMRDADKTAALERVKAVLAHVNRPQDLPRVHVVLGDASQPRLGISKATSDALRERIDAVIHCAACTSFNPLKDSECWATNVGGVAHLLEFLRGTHIPLYHVSTAYVAGKRRGVVYETELDVAQEFNNTYERSKCESEKMVRRALDEGLIRGSIFRPSIIIGAMNDGRISQFMNFYNVLHLVDIIASRRADEKEVVRMSTVGSGTKNLIPVDWTAKALWTIIDREGPSGQVYHLTSPRPVTHEMILAWANRLLKPANIQVAFVDNIEGKMSSLEAILSSRLQNYHPYLMDEPQFDRTNTDRALNGSLPFPEINIDQFDKLLVFARAQQWRSLFSVKRKAVDKSPVAIFPSNLTVETRVSSPVSEMTAG